MSEESTGCSSFEIAIEQRRHGALPQHQAEALDGHLAGCPGCRGYAEAAARADAALGAAGAAAVAGVDWARVETGIRRELRSSARRIVYDVASAAVMVPVLLWGLVPEGQRWEVAPAALLAVTAAALVRAGFHGWLARRRMSLHGTELLAFHRAALRADLWRAGVGQWLAGAMTLAATIGALAPGAPGRARVALALCAALVAATWTYVVRSRMPRLRRQLEALGPEERG